MATDARAGKPAQPEDLIDPDRLVGAYYDVRPDPAEAAHRVAFGTSGHRGSPLDASFNEAHILAITQAICDQRRAAGLEGPLFLGKDTHAASRPAERTAIEVLAANGVETIVMQGDDVTPTPVVSREILAWNRDPAAPRADGIVVTPSHNPPRDGGFKYNPPHGGPADQDLTAGIEARANELLASGLDGVRRVTYEEARRAGVVSEKDFVRSYLADLEHVIDLEVIRASDVRIGIDPLGGAALPYVQALRETLGLNATVVNESRDPTFGFMTLDHDGRIRMDCSSPFAMASLIRLKDDFDVAFGMDPDADRHGIVAPSCGLLNPNRYLGVAIRYLLLERPAWRPEARVGKTLVSSGIIDRVVEAFGRRVYEVPVGFKWFSGGLGDGSLLFGGEESAGASFLCRDGAAWTTDKDGILLGLLAAELTARTGKDVGEHADEIADEMGASWYRRVDQPATAEVRARLKTLSADDVRDAELAGDPIRSRLTAAPGNGAGIGGLKVVTDNGWFAARPSGTEPITKVYAESFVGAEHLERIHAEARTLVERATAP